MLKFINDFITRNAILKIVSLVLALVAWFYIVDELNKGSAGEKQFLNRILPSEGVSSRRLTIRPVFVGSPRQGYFVDSKKTVIQPEYCIIMGTRELLEKIKYGYTMPIDVSGATATFTKSVPLSPITPGVFTEETLVQITVVVEKGGR